MSVEQFIAILTAITALVVAVAGLIVQARQTHNLVNSRMGELLALTKAASLAQGKLEGPDAPQSAGQHDVQ